MGKGAGTLETIPKIFAFVAASTIVECVCVLLALWFACVWLVVCGCCFLLFALSRELFGAFLFRAFFPPWMVCDVCRRFVVYNFAQFVYP